MLYRGKFVNLFKIKLNLFSSKITIATIATTATVTNRLCRCGLRLWMNRAVHLLLWTQRIWAVLWCISMYDSCGTNNCEIIHEWNCLLLSIGRIYSRILGTIPLMLFFYKIFFFSQDRTGAWKYPVHEPTDEWSMVSFIACKKKNTRSANKPYFQENATETKIIETVLWFRTHDHIKFTSSLYLSNKTRNFPSCSIA